MLEADQLADLATDLESYCVERKSSMSDKSKIEEAICAFSNDLPGAGRTGVVLVGVADDGRPAGLPITDQLLLSLSSIRSDGNILPFPHLVVYKTELEGVEIAVVEVEPSKNTPVRLRGTVRVRVGPRRGIATRDEERVLTERRRSWDGPFDQRAIPGAKLDELDLELFRREYLPQAVHPDTLRENDRSLPQQLAGLHLASPDAVPNVAGMLLLGYEPTAFIKGAYVQFLRIDGTELTDPIIDRKELTGPLPRVLDQMDEVSRAHIRTSTSIAGTNRERNHPDYPIEALQQLLRNAVMHRNYESSNAPVQWYWFSDRVELHNPGGLFGRATVESFGRPGGNDYRNPTIAAALHELGYVQRFGGRRALCKNACRENGNPEPEFTFGPTSVAVVVRAA